MDIYLKDGAKSYSLQFSVNSIDNLSKPKEKKFMTVDVMDFVKWIFQKRKAK